MLFNSNSISRFNPTSCKSTSEAARKVSVPKMAKKLVDIADYRETRTFEASTMRVIAMLRNDVLLKAFRRMIGCRTVLVDAKELGTTMELLKMDQVV